MSKRKILITGKGSYVGTNFIKWLEQWPDQYEVVELSVRGTEWKERDFSVYDVVLHLAALVHKKKNLISKHDYYTVNRDLALAVAKKAKSAGVRHFIYMSSMAVYGVEGSIGKKMNINHDSMCNPVSFYGESKMAGENELTKLRDDQFKIAIVRPPMVYGPHCPGNYERLKKIALSTPIFPLIKNERSMIFVDHLSEFLKKIIFHNDEGVFLPQNKEFVCTSELVKIIAKIHNKKIYYSPGLGFVIRLFGGGSSFVEKVFGNLYYDKRISHHEKYDYCSFDFEESIKRSDTINI